MNLFTLPYSQVQSFCPFMSRTSTLPTPATATQRPFGASAAAEMAGICTLSAGKEYDQTGAAPSCGTRWIEVGVEVRTCWAWAVEINTSRTSKIVTLRPTCMRAAPRTTFSNRRGELPSAKPKLRPFSCPSQHKSQLLCANPVMTGRALVVPIPRRRRNGLHIPLSELHVDGCAPGRGWHRTSLLAAHLRSSGRRPRALGAPSLAQNLWAPFLVLFAGCPNILGIGAPSRGQLLRESRHFAPMRAVPSTQEPHNPCNE